LIKNVDVEVEKSPASTLLGNKIISKSGSVVLDWNKHKISLEKIPDPEISKSFGFTPLWQDDKIKVVKLREDTPVKKAGLQLGDTLVSINGRDIRNFSQAQFCAHYEDYKELETIRFTVKRGDSTQVFSVERSPVFRNE